MAPDENTGFEREPELDLGLPLGKHAAPAPATVVVDRGDLVLALMAMTAVKAMLSPAERAAYARLAEAAGVGP